MLKNMSMRLTKPKTVFGWSAEMKKICFISECATGFKPLQQTKLQNNSTWSTKPFFLYEILLPE